MNIIKLTTPNYRATRKGYKPEAIVIHIMDGSLPGTDSWFANANSKVSAHYGVGKKGEVHQYVLEQHTAQHAGVVDNPSWSLIKQGVNPNFYTIGIEHEGYDGNKLTDVQMQTSAELIAAIAKRWNIPLDRKHVIQHHEIRRTKTCPGSGVDVDQLVSLAKQF